MMQNAVLKPLLIKIRKLSLLTLGTILWSITMVKSGWFYSTLGTNGPGFGFWGANGHDGIWHIALSESLSRGSFDMPVFSGFRLQNYHIGFDLVLALLHRVTYIPLVNLYFQIIPIILAFLIGYLTYNFVIAWRGSDRQAFWATFYVYFGGSLGWLIGRSESAFWSQQSISTLINPPFAISLVLLLIGLLTILQLEKKYTLVKFLLTIVVFGSLIEVKAYAGVLALGALFVSGGYLLLVQKKHLLINIFVWSLILSIILYLPLNHGASGLLVFQPFWFLESMMGLYDRLNYQKFYSAMINYRSGHSYFKAFTAYSVAFAIFIIGNMGVRILGLFILSSWIKRIKKLDWVEVFLVSIIFGAIIIPLFFVQKGTPWNTIQFFYYALFAVSLLTGVVLSFIKHNWILIILALLTIPTTVLTLKDVYIPNRPPAMLEASEIAALNYLSSQPDGIVLTKPFDMFASKNAETDPPRPLYLYTSTAYVSAFSKHQTFMEDEVNLDITNYRWQERRNEVLNWYAEKNNIIARDFLINNNIKYIYWIKVGQSPLDLAKLSLLNIYENGMVTIYKVE